jgi:hypothetical protein
MAAPNIIAATATTSSSKVTRPQRRRTNHGRLTPARLGADCGRRGPSDTPFYFREAPAAFKVGRRRRDKMPASRRRDRRFASVIAERPHWHLRFLPFTTQDREQHSVFVEHARPDGLHVDWQAAFVLHWLSAQSTLPSQSSSTLPVHSSAPSVQSSRQELQLSPFTQRPSPQQ